MDILKKTEETIQKQHLIEKNDRILAAVSGGSDSVALLDILCRLQEKYGFLLFCAHVNHNLRETAGRDQAFVEDLCRRREIPCFVESVDVEGYRKRRGISAELAGRELRYAFFQRVQTEKGINKIATAHNQDDAAESVLLHLIRGSGLAGLCGIPYARADGVIRPLLDLEKTEIEAYCRERGLQYVVDETNFSDIYTRNKLRLRILPQLRQINPAVCKNITKNAQILAEDEKFLNAAAQEAYNKAVQDFQLELSSLQAMAPAIRRRVVQILWRTFHGCPENLQAVHVEAVLRLAAQGKTGSRIQLPRNTDAAVEYGKLRLLSRIRLQDYCVPVEIGQDTVIPGTGRMIRISPCDRLGTDTKTKIYCAFPDDAVLYVRTRRPGDFFYPVGMTGRKRLSDFFTDRKVSRNIRDQVPLLFCGEDLVWVAGYRRDRRFCAKKDKKRNYAVEIYSEI